MYVFVFFLFRLALLLTSVQLQSVNAKWTLFAVTNSTNCAKALPSGYAKISTNWAGTGTGNAPPAYVSLAHRGLLHKHFLQKFYVDGVLKFQATWTFPEYKTLQKRFRRAKDYGEYVEYEIIDYTASNGVPVRTHGSDKTKWFFSSTSNDPMGKLSETTKTSGFSDQGGTWGISIGTVDSSNVDDCGAKKSVWWGHENCKSASDFRSCDMYQHSNSHSSTAEPKRSNNIVNLMYAGSPTYNYGRLPGTNGYTWPNVIGGTEMTGCAVPGVYKDLSGNTFDAFQPADFTPKSTITSGSKESYLLTFINPSKSLATYDANRKIESYSESEKYDLYLTVPDTWPNLRESAKFSFSHP